MCTRYLILEEHYRTILKLLGVDPAKDFLSRFNVAPGGIIPVVRPAPATAAPPGRESAGLRWGLIPSWSKDGEGAHPANARAETIHEKPMFRTAVRSRRCVIPASGFYEWEHRGRFKQPWLIRRQDEQPFGFAGIWESWRARDGTGLETCALVTTEANELMRPIHHRMPVMLAPEQFDAWLDPAIRSPEQLAPLLRGPPATGLKTLALDTFVSNSRNEGPRCLAPAPAGGHGSPQLSLDL